MSANRGYGFLGLIALLALALRITNLTHTSLWQDEIYSLMVATLHNTIPPALDLQPHAVSQWVSQSITWQPMALGQLLEILKDNVHMPLYYLLLNPWLTVFGVDEFGLRTFSVFFSVLMLWPLYELAKSMFNERMALIAVYIAAVSPFQIYFAQEGRMYALVMFWAVTSTLCLWKVLFSEKPAKWATGYALSVLLGMMSHYVFVFLLGFHAAFAIACLLAKNITALPEKRLFWFLPAGGVLMALAAWWYPVYKAQKLAVDDGGHFVKGQVDILQGVFSPVWLAMVSLAGDNEWLRVFYFPLIFILPAIGLWLWLRQSAEAQQAQLGQLLLVVYWIVIPVWFMFYYDLMNDSHMSSIDRYGTIIAPTVYLMLAWDAEKILTHFNVPKILSVVAAMMLLLAVANVWAPSPLRDEHNKKDLRTSMAYFAEHAGKNDLILAAGVSGTPVLTAYYLNNLKPQQPMIYWVNNLRGKDYPLPDVLRLKQYDTIWLFKIRATDARGGQALDNHLRAAFPKWEEQKRWDIYHVR